jgi:hypothetical protein
LKEFKGYSRLGFRKNISRHRGHREIILFTTKNTKDMARPLAATKFEIRISKYETNSNDKKLKFKTNYNLLIKRELRMPISKNEQKKYEVDGL